ncbi:MAG: DUF4366 domain-containing protein [Lachnospiraceae bacterium]|nr:DUF4366 domain-containing protein [Lachnospiraceae bacterium]
MKRIKANLIKLLSGLSLAAFFVGANMTPMTVYAQSHENETDTEGPIINSAISDGRLVVEAYDESGIAAIYVNDYEFTDVPDGVLSIRLQQFDSGYEQFRLSAIDTLGNESFDYYIDNPYYDTGDGNQENPAKDLPVDASPSGKTDAKADVTDYTEVKGDDGSAKLFYTFKTESGKVFYLIIDRTENSEVVHFVTDVSENDLLNTTSDNSETLPKNSAAIDSGRPVTIEPVQPEMVEENETEVETETNETTELQQPVTEENPMGMYIVLGIIGAGVIGGAYYLKVIKKKEDFIDEEDDEDNEEELEIEDDDDPSNDEFFNAQEGEEEKNE